MSNRLKIISHEIWGVLLAPLWIMEGIGRLVRFEKQGGILLSFSQRRNSINDHTGINTIANWMKRYGYWGANYENSGRTVALSYPPLTYYIFSWLGLSKTFVLSQLMFLTASAAMLAVSHPILLLLLPYIINSPFYKNIAIVCGRHDVMAMSLLVVMLLFFDLGWTSSAMVLAIPMSLMHPAMCILGWLVIGIEFISGNIPLNSLVFVLVLNMAALLPWLYPYISNLTVTKYLSHSWRPPGYRDVKRTLPIILQKTLPYVIFSIFFTVKYQHPNVSLLLLLPILFEVNDYFRGSIMNRFTIDLLKLVLGMLCVALHPDIIIILLYVLYLYWYASPSPRKGLQIDPVYLPENSFNDLQAFLCKASGKKTVIVSFPVDGDSWRREAKIVDLCTMVNSYGSDPTFLSWVHFPKDANNYGEQIDFRARESGAEYLIFTEEPKSFMDSGEVIDRVKIPPLGDIPPAELYLLKIHEKMCLIEPHAEFKLEKNKIVVEVRKGQSYAVKFMRVTGWSGNICGAPVKLAGDDGSIRFVAPESGSLTLEHCYKNYWCRKG